MKTLVALMFVCVLAGRTSSLSCWCPEDRSACPRLKLTEVECPFGVLRDNCNCCDVCTKGPGESCGGPWNIRGSCTDGFTCMPKPGDEEKFAFRGTCQPQSVKEEGGYFDEDRSIEILYQY